MLAHLDPLGMRFYLPAFIVYDVRRFGLGGGAWEAFNVAQFASVWYWLDDGQLAVLRGYLLFLAHYANDFLATHARSILLRSARPASNL
jgi:hypothetical protein